MDGSYWGFSSSIEILGEDALGHVSVPVREVEVVDGPRGHRVGHLVEVLGVVFQASLDLVGYGEKAGEALLHMREALLFGHLLGRVSSSLRLGLLEPLALFRSEFTGQEEEIRMVDQAA